SVPPQECSKGGLVAVPGETVEQLVVRRVAVRPGRRQLSDVVQDRPDLCAAHDVASRGRLESSITERRAGAERNEIVPAQLCRAWQGNRAGPGGVPPVGPPRSGGPDT